MPAHIKEYLSSKTFSYCVFMHSAWTTGYFMNGNGIRLILWIDKIMKKFEFRSGSACTYIDLSIAVRQNHLFNLICIVFQSVFALFVQTDSMSWVLLLSTGFSIFPSLSSSNTVALFRNLEIIVMFSSSEEQFLTSYNLFIIFIRDYRRASHENITNFTSLVL